MNVNNPDNAGLADLVASLDTVYTTNGYDTVLSRADFWALAGVYAVDKTIDLNNDDCEEDDCEVPDSGLIFQWGRTDCDTAPYTDVDIGLPSALLNHSNVGCRLPMINIFRCVSISSIRFVTHLISESVTISLQTDLSLILT